MIRFTLQNQKPEIVLEASDTIEGLSPSIDIDYDIYNEELILNNVESYFNYLNFIRKYPEEFSKINRKRTLDVIYGKNAEIRSNFPWISIPTNIFDKNCYRNCYPYILLDNGEKGGLYKKDEDLIIFTKDRKERHCISFEELSNKYRSPERLKCSQFIQTLYYQIQLFGIDALNLIKVNNKTCRILEDLKSMTIKYQIKDRDVWNLFGPHGFEKLTESYPIRSVQWKDDEDTFGIWLKPEQVFGSTLIPEGKAILSSSLSNADLRDIEYYSFSNNNGVAFFSGDSRFLLIKFEHYGNYARRNWLNYTVAFSPYGFSKDIISEKEEEHHRLQFFTVQNILEKAYPNNEKEHEHITKDLFKFIEFIDNDFKTNFNFDKNSTEHWIYSRLKELGENIT